MLNYNKEMHIFMTVHLTRYQLFARFKAFVVYAEDFDSEELSLDVKKCQE